jgi:hypothetical protein
LQRTLSRLEKNRKAINEQHVLPDRLKSYPRLTRFDRTGLRFSRMRQRF